MTEKSKILLSGILTITCVLLVILLYHEGGLIRGWQRVDGETPRDKKEQYLQAIQDVLAQRTAMDKVVEKVMDLQGRPFYAGTYTEAYRKALEDGMAACDKVRDNLEWAAYPREIHFVFTDFLNSVSDARLGFKYYRDATFVKDPGPKTEMANQRIRKYIENGDELQPKITSFMKNNGFKVEKLANGEVRYSYNKE